MSSPIEDCALIGVGQAAALVNRNGSIDWLCWPQFDSDACFCGLFGTDDNGHWSIAPRTPARSISRRYEEDTLVLQTDLGHGEDRSPCVPSMGPRHGAGGRRSGRPDDSDGETACVKHHGANGPSGLFLDG